MGGSLTYNELFNILCRCGTASDWKIFVETGTYMGETIKQMAPNFETLYTIEIDPILYYSTSYTLKSQGINNVNFILGDSSVELAAICETVKSPMVFFLDGHFSSGDTGRGSKDCPLLDEIKVIASRTANDVIIIDDYRLFGTKNNEDWSEISEKAIMDIFGTPKKSFVSNDRLIIYN